MISIYIHIPFCLRKCNYCGFVSGSEFSSEDITNYVTLLIKEIELVAETYNLSKEKITTIFLGGGTPSILNASELHNILLALENNFNTSELAEISIEVNPASNFDFKALKTLGFNRISLGVQSFNNSELLFLGRLHDAAQSRHAVESAKQYFDNVSIDLMYGLPGQALSAFDYTMDMALELGIGHISAYSLTYEPGTRLWNDLQQGIISQLAVDTECDMYKLACDKLLRAGIFQYEVSNFAKPGLECLHNLRYWRRESYIGFGVAAHSLWGNTRYSNTSDVSLYVEKLGKNHLPLEQKELLGSEQIWEEQIFLGLRSGGIDINLLWSAGQISFMEDCVNMRYAMRVGGKYVLTSAGRFLTDSIVLKLLTIK